MLPRTLFSEVAASDFIFGFLTIARKKNARAKKIIVYVRISTTDDSIPGINKSIFETMA